MALRASHFTEARIASKVSFMSLGLQQPCAPRGLVMARNGSSGVGREHQGSLRVITPACDLCAP
jgi:hypothetical protein